MGVRRSAEGLAPRPPSGRRRKNRKRRRIFAARSHGRKPPPPPAVPPPPAPRPAAPSPIRRGRTLLGSPAQRGRWCSPAGPPCVFRTSGAASGPNGCAGRTHSIHPVCHLFNFIFFFSIFFYLSPRCAKDRLRHARRQVPGGRRGEGGGGSLMVRDRSGGGASFTAVLPLPGLVLRPLCFH